ncbi:aldehyde dehydrogenase family protein [Amycolatopsis thermophila]|uniref:Acyl-CoA reductase-like NAD-dependent aldehyde dehydrogenase n=1 Tax=Amycolatopsis thermophila TaxID=206084 RepID=A0ABU0F5E8_9PSEU|nr:aldehyde dehydrogenase family protein [Amycolatopsis thermophila]MDQ0382554.1 acyl-CoA reductase-like NAD-dependent aldehyde dehydrogenase [Amycolatopsis thermophila]
MDVAGVTVPHADEVFVAGEWVPAVGEYRIVSPSTGQPVATVGLPSVKHAQAAVDAARTDGLASWAEMPVAGRVEICDRFCAAMEARLDDMGTVWAVESGMPVRYSRTLHRFAAVGAWRTLLDSAENVLRDTVRGSALGDVVVRREPAGVVAAIMAYNGPLVTMASKALPALLAGCPVVVKAAVESQLIMRIIAECAAGAGFPAGALSILCGDVEIGRELSANPHVDMVSLTGGRAAAQQIIESTRHRFARTHLELGGKSPALILDDADLTVVLKTLVPGATSGAGQICAALSRILVPERRHDEVVELLRQAWEGLRIGDPLDPRTQIGPVAAPSVVERAEGFVARAVADGARVVAGGRRPAGFDAGWYFEPTLVTDVARDSDLARNEVFGPVTAVLTYRDDEDGLRLANDTSYGLAASVYTADRDKGVAYARRIRAGSVAVNAFGPALTAPFGGMKGSGWGREAGPEGICEFTELKQILIGPSGRTGSAG